MTFTTRFAPSPTGPLHLGHAYSALLAWDMAQRHGGTFLLRIEDIDRTRARPEWEAQIHDDLTWLGLHWPQPVMRQSDRMDVYADALDALWARGLLYPCDCSRRDITEALSAPQEGALPTGPDGLIYPGTCRSKNRFRYSASIERPRDRTLRLTVDRAVSSLAAPQPDGQIRLGFAETGTGPAGQGGEIALFAAEIARNIGDIVLARRDMGTSYHLSVVLDDAAQGITDVVRGQDLFETTEIHVVLQSLLKLPTPRYHHHELIRDDAGKRLAKRDDARALTKYRAEGATPQDIRRMVNLPLITAA
ncbi:tRNA glutamyl-Q(34) synthetase GluQRS [Roseobacter sp. EG26]|uniref:tRNA glutamyl-Q(34) synthetase GluQRS n=1 Tax=Roseobacter sp. EG26 TaxID=3412477 RepID=UPI003CE49CF2